MSIVLGVVFNVSIKPGSSDTRQKTIEYPQICYSFATEYITGFYCGEGENLHSVWYVCDELCLLLPLANWSECIWKS